MKRGRRADPWCRKKWRESFTVWIDFVGYRPQIGPLLDHIAGMRSNGGGAMIIGPPLCDQSWDFIVPARPRKPERAAATAAGIGSPQRTAEFLREETQGRAESVFERLKHACKTGWSQYIRLRLLHDDKPDRCSPVEVCADKRHMLHVKHGKNPRGPLVLRTYERGKVPKFRIRKRGRKCT